MHIHVIRIPNSPYHVCKLLRAYGGCLGAKCRRRTWYTAISLGESCADAISEDVRMGKPTRGDSLVLLLEHIE